MSHKETKQGYNSLDFFKFIMAICVVAIHTSPLVNSTNRSLLVLYDLVVTMAVPFFFLSSGYLLGARLEISGSPQYNTAVIHKQLIKLVKMYLIWSAVYLPLAICSYYIEGKSLPFAIIHYIRGLVLIGEHYNSWHLWYLLSAIYALVVISIMFRLGVRKRHFPIISILAAIISIGLHELVLYSGALPGTLQLLKEMVTLTILNGRIFRGLIYVPIGIYMAQKPISSKLSITLFVLGFIGNYYVENSALSSILLIVTSIAFFCIALGIKLKDHTIYPTLRSLSTKVYLLHMYIWTGYYLVIYGKKNAGIDSFVATAILSILISYVYLRIEKQVKCKYVSKNATENTKI